MTETHNQKKRSTKQKRKGTCGCGGHVLWLLSHHVTVVESV